MSHSHVATYNLFCVRLVVGPVAYFSKRPMEHGSVVVHMHVLMCMCDTMLCMHFATPPQGYREQGKYIYMFVYTYMFAYVYSYNYIYTYVCIYTYMLKFCLPRTDLMLALVSAPSLSWTWMFIP